MRMLTVLLALATACGGGTTPAGEPSTGSPENVTGLISEVRFQGEDVVAFVVEARGDSYELLIDPEFEYGFNLKHLEKHRADGLPVYVEISEREGGLYAQEILDA